MPKKVIEKPQYTFKKQIYSSKFKLSEATGIDRRALTKLIEENPSLTIDEMVEQYKKAQITYEYEGKSYSSIKEAAKALELNKKTVSKYLKLADNNLEKAMDLYKEEHTYAVIDGVRYETQEELAKSLNTTVKTLNKYIKSEGSIEAAVAIIKLKSRVYNWNGKEYHSLESVSNAMQIPRQTLKRIMENETDGDIVKAHEIYQKRNKGKYIYEGKGLKFDSIGSLANYIGKSETTVARNLKKYDGNVDKAIFMMKIRDLRKQKIQHENFQISTEDMAIILGIKQNELIAYLNSGMTIDEIKEFTNKDNQLKEKRTNSPVIMYDNNTSLAQFYKEHKINYACIYYAITTYGKSKEEALKQYYQTGRRIPNRWIYEKYGVILKHLLINEGINSNVIVAEMRNKIISFKEAMENNIVREEAKKLKLDANWQIELYSILTAEHIPEEEKEEFKKEFYVTEKEEECINKAKDRNNKMERKLLLYEMAECVRDNVYPENEMMELMKEYKITEEEIDTIFLDLYANFNKEIGIVECQDLAQKRKKLENDIRIWEEADEYQKREIKEKDPDNDWEKIENIIDKIAFYKNGIRLKSLTGQDIGMAGYTANIEQCEMASQALEDAKEVMKGEKV